MALLEEGIIKQIDNLLKLCGQIKKQGERRYATSAIARQVYTGTLSIVSCLYDSNSSQMEAVRETNSRIMNYGWNESLKNGTLVSELKGILDNVRVEIEGSLIKSIREDARGEVLADFIVQPKMQLAKT